MQYNLPKLNIKPVHKDFSSLGSSTTLGVALNPLASSARAFQVFQSLGTSTTFNTPASSGFQYVGVPAVLITKASAEAQPGADTLTIKLSKYFIDAQPSADYLFTGHKIVSEAQPGGDSLAIKLTKYFTEAQPGVDKLSRAGTLAEAQPGADSLTTKITKYFIEAQPGSDSSIQSFYSFSINSTAKIAVEPTFAIWSTEKIAVTGTFNSRVGVDVEVTPNSLAAVTSPSSLSNPFLPTVILGGTTYLTNACTAPPPGYTVTAQTYYVQYVNSGIGNTTFCDVTNSNMSIDYSGGTFSISSQNPMGLNNTYQGNLAKQVTAYGLQGTITDFGQALSNSQQTYLTDGIFGSPLLNKQFTTLTTAAGQYLVPMNAGAYNQGATSQVLVSNGVATQLTPIYSSQVAQSIASICGCTVSWLIYNGIVTNGFGQAGMTGLEALSSLASNLGGQLRWDGGNHYTVAYPTYYSGTWTVPNDKLLTASGLSYKWHLDLGYGVAGTGVLGIPVNLIGPGGANLPEGATSPNNNIQKVATITKPFTSEDPPLIIDLPNDTLSAKIQILVKPGQNSGGQYVTDDPTVWYDLGSPGPFNPYVKINQVGNSNVNQWEVDYTLFPNLAAINNGNFVMSLGVTRNSLNGQFAQSQGLSQMAYLELLTKIAANVKFIKTYSGTISCNFFGSLPLPGMWASATSCGTTVAGIVESVNVAGSGIVTIGVAQYYRINFNDATLNWDLSHLTSSPII